MFQQKCSEKKRVGFTFFIAGEVPSIRKNSNLECCSPSSEGFGFVEISVLRQFKYITHLEKECTKDNTVIYSLTFFGSCVEHIQQILYIEFLAKFSEANITSSFKDTLCPVVFHHINMFLNRCDIASK